MNDIKKWNERKKLETIFGSSNLWLCAINGSSTTSYKESHPSYVLKGYFKMSSAQIASANQIPNINLLFTKIYYLQWLFRVDIRPTPVAMYNVLLVCCLVVSRQQSGCFHF